MHRCTNPRVGQMHKMLSVPLETGSEVCNTGAANAFAKLVVDCLRSGMERTTWKWDSLAWVEWANRWRAIC